MLRFLQSIIFIAIFLILVIESFPASNSLSRYSFNYPIECFDAAETAVKGYNSRYGRNESLEFLIVCMYDQNEYIYTLTIRLTRSGRFCENIRVKFEPTGYSDYRLETLGSCES